MEYKTVQTEFKAGEEDGQYEGHFSVFGNIDDGEDIMHAGAFAKTIAERRNRIKVFYAHDWEKLIGPPPAELREDDIGLFAKGRLTLGSFWGREVNALMRDEALTEGSIGFETIKFDYDESGLRNLREVKLYEISPVPLGMNPLTSIRAVKSGRIGENEFSQALSAITDAIQRGQFLISAEKSQLQMVKGHVDALTDAIAEKLAAAEPDRAADHSALLQLSLRAAEAALAPILN